MVGGVASLMLRTQKAAASKSAVASDLKPPSTQRLRIMAAGQLAVNLGLGHKKRALDEAKRAATESKYEVPKGLLIPKGLAAVVEEAEAKDKEMHDEKDNVMTLNMTL